MGRLNKTKINMKKLISTILASSFLLSCSSDSSNDDSNNPSSTGLLLKTVNYGNGVVTYSYNGNKLTGSINSNGSYGTATYNGDFVSQIADFNPDNTSYVTNYTYSNNRLSTKNISTNYANPPYTENSTFTHNVDGSVTENKTRTTSTGVVSQKIYIYYFTSGNLTKKEEFNSAMTLTHTTTFTYDNKNSYVKNITGFIFLNGLDGFGSTQAHNETGYVKTNNITGNIEETEQITYTYNSQDYPISMINTSTSYYFNPQTNTNTPSTPQTYSETYTYY